MSDDNDEVDQGGLGDDWEAALAEQEEKETGGGAGGDDADAGTGTAAASGQGTGQDGGKGGARAERAPLDDLADEGGAAADEEVNMDVILDIPVTLSMEIGRTRINIRNLLQLNQGSVVELDRLAGEPLDVLVNGTLIAHGEVVVVNERFGIRLTDVISPSERVQKLK